MYHIGGLLLLNRQEMAPLIIREETRLYLSENGPRSSYIVYRCLCSFWFCSICLRVGNVYLLTALAETDVIRRFRATIKNVVSTPVGNRTQDLPHVNRTH